MTPGHRSTSIAARGLAIAWLFLGATRCGPAGSAGPSQPTVLTMGFANPATEAPGFGMQAAASVIAFEGLGMFDNDGRPRPKLAESWSEASDGLSWRIHLRSAVWVHDGSILDTQVVVAALRKRLLPFMGPAG